MRMLSCLGGVCVASLQIRVKESTCVGARDQTSVLLMTGWLRAFFLWVLRSRPRKGWSSQSESRNRIRGLPSPPTTDRTLKINTSIFQNMTKTNLPTNRPHDFKCQNLLRLKRKNRRWGSFFPCRFVYGNSDSSLKFSLFLWFMYRSSTSMMNAPKLSLGGSHCNC